MTKFEKIVTALLVVIAVCCAVVAVGVMRMERNGVTVEIVEGE